MALKYFSRCTPQKETSDLLIAVLQSLPGELGASGCVQMSLVQYWHIKSICSETPEDKFIIQVLHYEDRIPKKTLLD